MYRGDSIEKNRERLIAYSSIGRARLYNMKHIVIAGTCGDIDALVSLGVRASDIIACDAEPARRAWAKRKGAEVPPGSAGCDIVATVKWAHEKYGVSHSEGKYADFGSVNVDLCKTLPSGVPILSDVADELFPATPLFFTFLCGRDGMPLYCTGNGHKMQGAHVCRKCGSEGESTPGYLREQYFKDNTPSLDHTKVSFRPYQSWTRESKGSPMCFVVCN